MEPEISFFDNLILTGALEVEGISEDGKFIYKFTDKIDEVSPGLKEVIRQSFFESVMHLWDQGFLSVSINEDNDEMVSLTDLAFDKEALSHLDQNYLKTLGIIIKALEK